MEEFLVISGLGPDRPGLVAETTRYLAERGGNIEDSRMAVLGGEFGILILVSGSRGEIEAITADSALLESRTGLTFLMRPTESPEAHRRATVVPCRVVAGALDHEGIVHAVAAALHDAGANIVSLHTSAYNAPTTGSPLFRLEASVDVPREVSVAVIRRSMEKVGIEQGLDIDVRTLSPET